MNNRNTRSDLRERSNRGASLARVAHHEAGHAIAAVLHGVQLTAATIIPSSIDDHGHVAFADPDSIPLAEAAIIGVAGPLAEAVYQGHLSGGFNPDIFITTVLLRVDTPDFALLRAIDEHLGRDTTRRLLLCTNEVLRDHWTAVPVVADALIHRRTLSHTEIYNLIAGTLVVPA